MVWWGGRGGGHKSTKEISHLTRQLLHKQSEYLAQPQELFSPPPSGPSGPPGTARPRHITLHIHRLCLCFQRAFSLQLIWIIRVIYSHRPELLTELLGIPSLYVSVLGSTASSASRILSTGMSSLKLLVDSTSLSPRSFPRCLSSCTAGTADKLHFN